MKKRRINLSPKFNDQIPMPKKVRDEEEAKEIGRQRGDISKKNTGLFYVNLFKAMFKKEMLENYRMPLFPRQKKRGVLNNPFFPDIVVDGERKTSYIEVKAVSIKAARPWFGSHQTAGYIGNLLQNPGSEMITGIFRYENRSRSMGKKSVERLSTRDNRGFVEILTKTTRDLLIMPHNLLAFLLMIPYLEKLDQTSSNSQRDSGFYRRPHGTWLSLLHKYHENPDEAIGEILKHAKTKNYWLKGLKIEDFFLDDLKARQFQSDEKYNIWCKSSSEAPSCKMANFKITKYETPYPDKWIKHLEERLYDFLDGLEIREIYDKKFVAPF